jgi:hypothetical protein
MNTWQSALAGRTELERYGDNRLLLFALALHQNLDDVELVASDSLTDGSNDKKCDLVHVNRESGKAIIAQGYWSNNQDRAEAPANKASDLNTAATWLLSREYSSMPDSLRTAAEELEAALDAKEVTSIEFWYVHNLPESKNVQGELDKVVSTVDSLLRRHFPQSKCESPSALEVGRETLDTWYRGTQAPILVSEKFSFETTGGFLSEGATWSAYSTSVPASWLHNTFKTHGRNLFSANVRDYLGSRRSDKNINHNIKDTARTSPSMFWVYNNGVTALVHDFSYTSQDDVGMLEITGIAIVNGAQTTGALGSVDDASLDGAFVPVRFVKCSDTKTVQNIIRFTNSQNKIEAADFRSNDSIQTRLRREFKQMKILEYLGGRRGGDDDSIRRPRNLIPSSTAGQALMAFHGDPVAAYNESGNIWQSDTLYAKIFNPRTSARHLVLAYSLLKAVDAAKAELRAIEPTMRTESQNRQWEAFRQRGATYLLTSALSGSIEVVMGRAVPDKFRLQFAHEISLTRAMELWSMLIKVAAPLIGRLAAAFAGGSLKNRAKVAEAVAELADVLTAVRESNPAPFESLAREVTQS